VIIASDAFTDTDDSMSPNSLAGDRGGVGMQALGQFLTSLSWPWQTTVTRLGALGDQTTLPSHTLRFLAEKNSGSICAVGRPHRFYEKRRKGVTNLSLSTLTRQQENAGCP